MKQYVVDAFTDHIFGGNPAAVCVMDEWLPDTLLQKIASENSLPETAFAVKEGELYHLRWFTPASEVNLCGHATLATSYVITRFVEPECRELRFTTRSGILTVTREGDLLTMDFPSFALTELEITDEMVTALGVRPLAVWKGEDLIILLENEAQVRAFDPKHPGFAELGKMMAHVTAPGDHHDCATRSFALPYGPKEDPVCGRGHCHVIPMWAERLGKTEIRAHQASARGGELYCRQTGERTLLSGKAALYSVGELYI